MSVEQRDQKQEKWKYAIISSMIGKRLMSVRVSYATVVLIVSWIGLALAFYFLRALGFLNAR